MSALRQERGLREEEKEMHTGERMGVGKFMPKKES